MSAPRLAQVWPKVERANEHIGDLRGEITGFLSEDPYKVGTKRDPQTRRPIYYLSGMKPMPVSIAMIAGDAIQNMMSALDHLAYQLVCGATNDRPPNPRWIFFPIQDDAALYEAKKLGKIKGARQSTIDAIDKIKPYKGGNDLLWMLYRLNIIDKHRLLFTVGARFSGVEIGAHMMRNFYNAFPAKFQGKTPPKPNIFLKPADSLSPLEIGDELFSDLPDAEVDEKMHFAFDIAISEPEVSKPESVLGLLLQLLGAVKDTVIVLAPELRV